MPKQNDSRLNTFGSYRALHSIECVDETQKLWRGRPVIEEIMKRPGMPVVPDVAWIFFSREYDERENKNDWDLLYHEILVNDPSFIGMPFILVPKEKLLFSYDPASDIIVRPRIKT